MAEMLKIMMIIQIYIIEWNLHQKFMFSIKIKYQETFQIKKLKIVTYKANKENIIMIYYNNLNI